MPCVQGTEGREHTVGVIRACYAENSFLLLLKTRVMRFNQNREAKSKPELKDANLRGVGEGSLGLTRPVTHFTWSFYKIKICISAC